jgi:hypothetical protein
MLKPADPLPLPHWRHVIVAVVFSVIGWLSLLGSYVWFTSSTWTGAFGTNGWWIELGRLVIGFVVALFLFGVVFREESDVMLSFRRADSLALRRARWAFGGLLAMACLVLAFHHIWLGPGELYARAHPTPFSGAPWLRAGTDRREYLVPYLWYVGYSFANMIVILFSVTMVSLTGSIRDISRVAVSCKKVVSPGAGDPIGPLFSAAEDLRDHGRRACYLLGGLLILIVYERYGGWSTLSNNGRRFAIAAYAIMSFAVLLVVCSHVAYELAFTKARRLLGPNAAAKIDDLSPMKVWTKARALFPIVAAVLTIATILAKQWVVPVFQGH